MIQGWFSMIDSVFLIYLWYIKYGINLRFTSHDYGILCIPLAVSSEVSSLL